VRRRPATGWTLAGSENKFFSCRPPVNFVHSKYNFLSILNFEDLGLSEQILESISAMNFRQATPVQELAIPTVLAGKDLIACAQTGTGKTAAYLLPILQKITQGEQGNYINTLVIVPTRELALQIDQQLTGFSYFLSVSSIPCTAAATAPPGNSRSRASCKGPTS
jgi:superfamily II DNA/RNA helicase